MLELISTALLASLMAMTILSDMRYMRIPNWLSLVGIAGFVALVAWTLPLDEVLWRAVAAGATLLIGFALFVLRTIGAGDVKIFSVLMLFVPTAQIPQFMLIFSATMIVGIMVITLTRKLLENPESSWAFLRNEKRLPMGVSIGAAGIIQVFF